MKTLYQNAHLNSRSQAPFIPALKGAVDKSTLEITPF